MTFESLELRWFLSGTPPDEVRAWFHGVGDPHHLKTESRQDVYYPLFDSVELSLKLRARTSLELKGRVADLPVIELETVHGEKLCGRPQRWAKWSTRLAVEALPQDPQARPVEIEKVRESYLFVPASGGGYEQALLGADGFGFVDEGIQVEIVSLRAPAGPYWSLAFEAFPWHPDDPATLLRFCEERLATYPGALPIDRAMSYPEWLATL